MKNWLYKGQEIVSIEDMPKGTFGFIYEITHIPSGRKYIGKKQLIHVNRVNLGKKELAKLTDRRASKKKVVRRESNWKEYFGSSKEVALLIESEGADVFFREILTFVPTKKLLTYYETKELFSRGVLEPGSTYINDNIEARYFRKDFLNGKDTADDFEDSE